MLKPLHLKPFETSRNHYETALKPTETVLKTGSETTETSPLRAGFGFACR
jgi:hypothetical protein